MLKELMDRYGSDKAPHGFCEFYESFFAPVRESVKSVLEIGVADGASIRAWLDYFPNANVWGMDAGRSCVGKYGDSALWPFENRRFFACIGDQANRDDLARLLSHPDAPDAWDIVIDDGGHTMEQQQVSLGVLFPHTRMFYVVEDLHTSFMDEITIYDPNGPKRSYPTGAIPGRTTYDFLQYLQDPEQMTWDGIETADLAPVVHIFDRDGDHKHMTSVLEVK